MTVEQALSEAARHEASVVAEWQTPPPQLAPPKAKNSVVRGSLWTIGGYGAGQILRFAGNIIVSRVLAPDCFGVMALVNVFLQALVMFSDVGIEPSVIQHKRGDERLFRNTAWTVQVVRGWILFAAAALLAWPVTEFYGEPQLLVLLPVAGLSSVIAGFNSTAIYSARRHLQLGRITAMELTSQMAGLVVMCAYAWCTSSVWALLVGPLVGCLVTAVGSHYLLSDYRNRFAWERAAFHDLFHFGKWIFLGTLILFCSWQIDRLMLGKLISMTELGVYSTGAAIATLPNLLLGVLANAVLFPLLAKFGRESAAHMNDSLRTARAVLLSIGWILIFGVVAEGPRFFSLLYEADYAGAGPAAQWLALAVWFQILSTTADRALPACGNTRGLVWFNSVKLVTTIPLTLGGYHVGGIPGFIVGLALGALAAHLCLLAQLREHGLKLGGQDLAYTLSLAIASAGVLLGGLALEPWTGWGNELVAAPILIGAGWFAVRRFGDLHRLPSGSSAPGSRL